MDTSQNVYLKPFTDSEIVGSEDFTPENFKCCKGTILVVLPPPKEKTKGGIYKPLSSLQKPSVGRVAAVPKDPLCPVKPGDWVVTRHLEGQPVNFFTDADLCLLQYSDDSTSEILGYFESTDFNLAVERANQAKENQEEELEEEPKEEIILTNV